MENRMKASIILTTYNSPVWLEKVLWGYANQSERDFEILIADDGSDSETRNVIHRIEAETGLTLQHVWHPDRGFRKSVILNRATVESRSDYLIYSDADCIPNRDFVSAHIRYRTKGHFLSGGMVRLPMAISCRITREDIQNGRVTRMPWLLRNGVRPNPKILASAASLYVARIFDRLTTTKASWNGHNSSGWRDDIVAANGFDERMQYGGLDRELGERLINAGIQPIQIRHRAICVHLDHSRSYESTASWTRNAAIRSETINSKRTQTVHGIRQSSLQKIA
jgi:glycosyltransferase involved in cell wall biosynthesis